MERKEYYTFADMMVKLRGNYKELRKILKEMEKCIVVISPYKTKYELSFAMRNPSLHTYDQPKLILSVTKEESTLSEKFKKAIMNIQGGGHNSLNDLVDNATFCCAIGEGKITFDFVNHFNFEHAFCPTVTLTDDSYIRFRELCDRLQKNRLYSLPEIATALNPYQTLFMNGKGLSLCDSNGKKWLDIGYNARIDRASVESNASYESLKVEELFMTKIPRYLLSPDCALLLDTLPGKVEDVYAEITGRKKENLALKLENNELGLAKKIGAKK